MQINEAIKLWKELGIVECVMDFSCGGDSMNDTEYHFYIKNDTKKKKEPSLKEIESDELVSFFDDEIYKNVEFYVNSDGHYIGECGDVRITLEDDEESFYYTKNATSEFSERGSEVMGIKLSNKEIDFLSNYVQNINGNGDGEWTINYKKDFILTKELEDLISDLETTILDEVRGYEPENPLGELGEFVSFTTNDDDVLDKLTLEGNTLKMIVNNEYQVFTPSTD